jgi:hypothetical protein
MNALGLDMSTALPGEFSSGVASGSREEDASK